MSAAGTSSVYILSIALGWFLAQVIKYLLQANKAKSWRNISSLYKSGSMPSVHTATVSALATSIGIKEGVTSAIFAVAFVLAIIVAYDSMQVRRSVGEQGLAINKLIKPNNKSSKLPYYSSGHLPTEVLAGAILGVLAGIVVIYITHF